MYIEFFGKKILFIHIPKTGGTAIEDMFCRYSNINIFEWPNYYGKNIWGRNNNLEYQHLTAKQIFDDFKLLKIDEIDFIFTVVRNPYDRFVSEVNWKLPYNKNIDQKNKNLALLNCFDDIKNNPLYCHNLSQVDFIDGYFDKIKIYKYEDSFDKIINDLKMLCSIDTEIIIKTVNPTLNKCVLTGDINEEDKKNIIKIYKNDFAQLGYV